MFIQHNVHYFSNKQKCKTKKKTKIIHKWRLVVNKFCSNPQNKTNQSINHPSFALIDDNELLKNPFQIKFNLLLTKKKRQYYRFEHVEII